MESIGTMPSGLTITDANLILGSDQLVLRYFARHTRKFPPAQYGNLSIAEKREILVEMVTEKQRIRRMRVQARNLQLSNANHPAAAPVVLNDGDDDVNVDVADHPAVPVVLNDGDDDVNVDVHDNDDDDTVPTVIPCGGRGKIFKAVCALIVVCFGGFGLWCANSPGADIGLQFNVGGTNVGLEYKMGPAGPVLMASVWKPTSENDL